VHVVDDVHRPGVHGGDLFHALLEAVHDGVVVKVLPVQGVDAFQNLGAFPFFASFVEGHE
jgi:hypothetical protein